MELNELSIVEAAKGLREKKFTSVELTRACLNRIEEKNPELNAFILVREKEALAEAKAAGERFKNKKPLSILDGIPMALKDNMTLQGVMATAGSKILENYVAAYDATVVRKLKAAGAVILGKTNMDEFAMGSSTETSAYGATKNPHDITKVPGGSSGGSAVAVADHMAIYALGSDTGGSIRQPAALCGVVGYKPTYGRVSRYGLIAMASSLDQIGPFAKTAEDARLVYDAIKGFDSYDSTTLKDVAENHLPQSLAGVRVGVPKEYFAAGMDERILKIIQEKIKKMKEADAEIVEISLPRSEYALAVYYILMPAEVSANLARFDGIRYGYSSPTAKNLMEVYNKSRGNGFGAEVRRRVILGTYVLSSGYYDAYYKKAQQVQTLVKADFDRAFAGVDIIVTPTSPSVAWNLGEKFDDPIAMYLADIYTVSVNVAGLPAISIPAGLAAKLPVGLQLIGKQFADDQVLALAKLVEKL